MAKRDWAGSQFRVHHGNIRSLNSPDWHYIAYDTLPPEMFSWEDTREVRNWAADSSLVDVVAEFRSILARRPVPHPADTVKSP